MSTQNRKNKISEEKVKIREKLNSQDKTIQRKDPKMFSSNGLLDVGPVDFDAREAEYVGDIMAVATSDVVTVPPTTTIMGSIKTMTARGFRRVPVTDAGTKRLEGIVTSVDIVDFLGGGDRNLLVEKHYNGNLLAAINAEVREIMQHNVAYVKSDAKIDDVLRIMLEKKTGGLPIVDDNNRVIGICTEKDFLKFIAGVLTNKSTGEYMSTNVTTVTPDTSIGDAAKIMVSKGFRRLPLVRDSVLIGIITASNIVHFLGNGEAFQKLITGNIHEAFNEPVSSLVSKDVVWISSDMDLGEAASLMIEKNVGSLPVFDDGKLCGIITERDFLRAIIE
ncbi:putative signal transduction protein with CBS domains [Methanosalsum zhilinae DSM 4017]|uniref:Putative signal transduction protein with CBS domains n=1 Tax=Methanosalsum zhilinae (strain DSM 4017 / NBRC 107636 / OCM 62 / WeN5) TaxID=679901 RepID=F7XMH8_METZD|nr:CBS domain-containing protein [Methanosalsum zhilinae]AEH59901.1 putative signal transduction protein with CBS domains [Methanosalsum zhilinae DSM 4017]